MALPRSFWLLWFGQTFGRMGILAPAFLILYLEQGKFTNAHTTPIVIGLFGAGVVTAGLVGGVFADIIGPRRTIVMAQLAALVTALLFALASNVYLIGLLALVAGVLSAADRPAVAGLIAKILPQDQFSRGYSILLVGFNIGMALSPVLSGFLLAFYPKGLFIFWAASCGLYALLVSSLPRDERGHGHRRIGAGIAEPFRTPVLRAFLVLTFLLGCVYLQLNSALPLDMTSQGIKSTQIGLILAINAVLPIALLPLVPWAVKRMRDETPLVIASVLMALGFGVQAFAHDIPVFVFAVVVWTLGEVLWAPMSTTYLVKRAPEGRTAIYQGAYFFAWNTAFVVGGPIGIVIGEKFGYSALWIGTLVLGLITAVGFRLMRRYDASKIELQSVRGDSEQLGGTKAG